MGIEIPYEGTVGSVDFPANSGILHLFPAVWFQSIEVVKVKLHQRVEGLVDPVRKWAALGNAAADAACKQALANDMTVVHEMVSDPATATQTQRTKLKAVFAYYLQLHHITNQRMTHTQEADPTSVADRIDLSQRLDTVSCMGLAVKA